MKPLGKFLNFAPPFIGEEEVAEVVDTLRSGWLTTGPKTERFEKELATYVGAQEGLALNSCTAALHLGLNVLGVGPGEGVITSPLTFASSAHAICYQGAFVFFADIDPDTGNLSPQKVREFLTENCALGSCGRLRHKETGASITTLLPVHYGGHPVDLEAFWQLAVEFKLNMLEDAAHALGARYQGRLLGDPGLKPAEAESLVGLSAFSFYATKNMTTGEGGFLVGSDLIKEARRKSMYGISDSRRIWGRYAPSGTWVYDVADLGFKYNMMDIQAALGLHQLRRLPEFIAARKSYAAIYNSALADFEELVVLPREREGVDSAWHLYPLRLRPEAFSISRDEFIETLRAHNIGTSVLFIPLHFHSYYQKRLGHGEGDFPAAESFFKGLINLPISPAHSPSDITMAAELIAGLLRKYRR